MTTEPEIDPALENLLDAQQDRIKAAHHYRERAEGSLQHRNMDQAAAAQRAQVWATLALAAETAALRIQSALYHLTALQAPAQAAPPAPPKPPSARAYGEPEEDVPTFGGW